MQKYLKMYYTTSRSLRLLCLLVLLVSFARSSTMYQLISAVDGFVYLLYLSKYMVPIGVSHFLSFYGMYMTI